MRTFLVGGARSGKSTVAQRLAVASGRPVAMVVTAEAIDDEMTERIDAHRADRPSEWMVVEAPYDLAAGIDGVPDDHLLLIDCLTLWLSNMMVRGDSDGRVAMAVTAAVRALSSHSSDVIVVSNEVGFGLVPPDPVSRRFRDAQGRLNQIVAQNFDRPFLVAAGCLLPLHPPEHYLAELTNADLVDEVNPT